MESYPLEEKDRNLVTNISFRSRAVNYLVEEKEDIATELSYLIGRYHKINSKTQETEL
jgi:hypothetical protein